MTLTEFILTNRLASDSEQKRLIYQRAIRVNNEKVTTGEIILKSGDVILVGRSRKFIVP